MKVKIVTTQSGYINVDAQTKEEAEKIAEEMYENGDFLFDEEGVDNYQWGLDFIAENEA